jgi:hypothetical protein
MKAARKRFLRPKELDQLTQLRDRIGITKLAAALDLPFYTCRDVLNVERVNERTAQRVRDHLPAAVERYLTKAATAPPMQREYKPLQSVDATIQATLSTLLPYVSMTRLAHVLGLSLSTLKAAAAGYRRMHAATADSLRNQLCDLMLPPYAGLRTALRSPPIAGAIDGLRAGVLDPIYGLDVAQTEALLLGDTPD